MKLLSALHELWRMSCSPSKAMPADVFARMIEGGQVRRYRVIWKNNGRVGIVCCSTLLRWRVRGSITIKA